MRVGSVKPPFAAQTPPAGSRPAGSSRAVQSEPASREKLALSVQLAARQHSVLGPDPFPAGLQSPAGRRRMTGRGAPDWLSVSNWTGLGAHRRFWRWAASV